MAGFIPAILALPPVELLRACLKSLLPGCPGRAAARS